MKQIGNTTVALLNLLSLILINACSSEPDESSLFNIVNPEVEVVRVTGEVKSANSAFFGPPTVPDIWNYTISFMAPEGYLVEAGSPILKFDTDELMTRLREKSNTLNERQKQLEKQEIVARDIVAELELSQQVAVSDLDKARLKADIPVELLASRDYKENKLRLEQAELTLVLRQQQVQKEQRIQDTEIKILLRAITVLDSEIAILRGSIDAMTIKATGPGVVTHSVDRRNNKHEVGDNVWHGRRVIELPDLSQLQVHLEVPERESARIAIGQLVQFVLDAVPDKQFTGEIVELGSVIHTKTRNQPARVFDATVSMKNPDPSVMRPGMSVSAEINLNSGKNNKS